MNLKISKPSLLSIFWSFAWRNRFGKYHSRHIRKIVLHLLMRRNCTVLNQVYRMLFVTNTSSPIRAKLLRSLNEFIDTVNYYSQPRWIPEYLGTSAIENSPMSVIPFTSITNRTSKSILVCFHGSIEIFLAIISTLNYSPASFPIKYTLCPLWFQPFGWLKIKFLFYRVKFSFYKRTLIWKKPFSDFLQPLLIFFMKIWWQETGKLSTGRFLGFCGLLKTCFIFWYLI